MREKTRNQPTASPGKKRFKPWIRYTGLATEMMAMLGIATFAGYKLDQWLQWKLPVFLIIFPLLALALLLWRLIKATGK